MPKQAFINLDQGKRRRIIRAALAEFANHDFTAANLDRICRRAHIPKGSLYQYFENKKKIFDFTSSYALNQAWEMLRSELEKDPPKDCFDLLRKTLRFVSSLRQKNPDVLKMYRRAGFEAKNSQGLQAIGEYNRTFLDRFINRGVGEGKIDPRLSRNAVAFLVDALSNRFQEEAVFKREKRCAAKEEERLLEEILDLLARALQPKQRQELEILHIKS